MQDVLLRVSAVLMVIARSVGIAAAWAGAFARRRAASRDRANGPLKAKRTGVPIQAAVAFGVALLMLMAGWSAVANHPQSSTAAGQTVTVEFDHDGDNEWWVEVLTRASGGSIVAMSARAESSSTSHGLQQKAHVNGWTKWGPETSFHIPPGDRVMFRAHVVDETEGIARTVDSCFFTHPAGLEQQTPECTTGNAFDASFSGVRGNEWWVQANVATNGPAISKVDVTTDGGKTFRPLQKQSWSPTAWAASYHLPQGTIVQLRATSTDGQSDLSSCHQWIPPSGQDSAFVVQCSSQPSGAFDASFSGVRGNEWWVQANVATNGPAISKVDVTTDGGQTFRPLEKKSWSPTAWAASYHIPQGTIVQLRATSTDGQSDLSSCRQWIPPSGQDAAIVQCSSQPSGAFDASFSGVKGNEWWVQVNVKANDEIISVGARIECEPIWRPLIKQSWGGWAASFFIPAGSRVDFQARNPSLASDVSGAYVWPDATPTTPCPQGNWPKHHSTVTYSLSNAVGGGGNSQSTVAEMLLIYMLKPDGDARWEGFCNGRDTFRGVDGTVTHEDWESSHVGFSPPYLPPRTHVGAEHRPDLIHANYGEHSCSKGWIDHPVTVVRQEDTQTAMMDANGNPITLRAWYAESPEDRPPEDNRFTTHWELKAGLVLDLYSDPPRSGGLSEGMTLVHTDAQLQ